MTHWRASLHPRNPEDGRFVSKGGGWLQVVVDQLRPSAGVAGRDRSGELNYARLAERIRRDSGTEGDSALGDIYDAQGFHGHPRVVGQAEMDHLIQSGGHVEMFRGVADAHSSSPFAGLTGKDFAQMFRTGDEHWPGYGMHGNGSYATTWQLEAQGYSDPHDADFKNPARAGLGHWPGVVRIAMPADARVIDKQRLQSMQSARLRASRDPNEVTVLADLGRFAAALGYDAIDLGPMSTAGVMGVANAPPSRNHYILFNRSILTVQEASN